MIEVNDKKELSKKKKIWNTTAKNCPNNEKRIDGPAHSMRPSMESSTRFWHLSTNTMRSSIEIWAAEVLSLVSGNLQNIFAWNFEIMHVVVTKWKIKFVDVNTVVTYTVNPTQMCIYNMRKLLITTSTKRTFWDFLSCTSLSVTSKKAISLFRRLTYLTYFREL